MGVAATGILGTAYEDKLSHIKTSEGLIRFAQLQIKMGVRQAGGEWASSSSSLESLDEASDMKELSPFHGSLAQS